jgi:hypothetical protein
MTFKTPTTQALALWAILAGLVFSDIQDHHTRVAAIGFMAAQYERRARGEPLETIENGFRPLVRQAARQAAPWPLLIFVVGAGATVLAGRHYKQTSCRIE